VGWTSTADFVPTIRGILSGLLPWNQQELSFQGRIISATDAR
jgi:hypothetical protein